MGGVCRIGIDSAGGTIIGSLQDGTVYCNGALVSVHNDSVQGHGSGSHANPKMVAGDTGVFINGIKICKAGDSATCGHLATGSSNVFVGES